jgi:uncharacterized protein with NRDE domain
LIAHRASTGLPLAIAGNRDEFHARPTQAAHWWPDRPDVLGGRDLQAGGTWLAIDRLGRFGAVTNFRDADGPRRRLASRGLLITGFLDDDLAPHDYTAAIDGERYAGFNLIVGDGRQMSYLSNRGGGRRELAPGVYAVANATLDTPWPKVVRTKTRLTALVEDGNVNATTLARLLDDRERARVAELDTDGLPFNVAHAMSAPFIVMPDYGTRASTVITSDGSRMTFSERRYAPDGRQSAREDFSFRIPQALP